MNTASTFRIVLLLAILLNTVPACAQDSAGEVNQAIDLADIKDGIAGRIIVFGDVPELPPLIKRGAKLKDQFCSQKDIPDESLIVGKDRGLANVFIYLRSLPDGLEVAANPDKKSLKSLDCRFVPHAQVIQTGQSLSLTNHDPVAEAINFRGFRTAVSLVVPGVGTDRVRIERRINIDNPERLPIQISDDLHPWKRAYILPLDHPYAAVTDKNGYFNISAGLPPGTHQFLVWHERVGYLDRKLHIEVVPDQPTELLLSYPAKKFQ